MIALGAVFLIVGLLVPQLAVLATIGIILLAIGVLLAVLGSIGHPVGGRTRWY